mgnify:FL=1|tara:strand:- start:5223 stop:5399 length:177 start_codon:yes stop_codon:yes gene_type:complete
MKVIKNDSYTGREIILSTPKGPEGVWITPREHIVVPDGAITNTIKNLAKRRILKITNA